MKKSAVIFDLDGTLMDSVAGLSRAMNEVLAAHNFPLRTTEEYKLFIGNGIKALVEQSVPDVQNKELLEQMYKEKSELYQKYWKEGSSLFPGIAELLTVLTEKHIHMAIISNKEDYFTQQIVTHFLHKWPFFAVTGRTAEIPKKPDPTGINMIISTLDIPHDQWLMVGDKDADIEAAKNAGIDGVWVSWGYQKTPPLGASVIHTPLELESYIS